MATHAKHHDYHLVDPSPWPVVGSVSAFVMALGAISWMHHMFAAAPIVFGVGTVGVGGRNRIYKLVLLSFEHLGHAIEDLPPQVRGRCPPSGLSPSGRFPPPPVPGRRVVRWSNCTPRCRAPGSAPQTGRAIAQDYSLAARKRPGPIPRPS